LEEVGVLQVHSPESPNQLFDCNSAINQVRKVPLLLHEQQLIKRNSVHEYGFVKNIMVEENDTRARKNKTSRAQQPVSAQLGSSNPLTVCFVSEGERTGKLGIEVYK
jgi:hypothetical protein